MGHGAAPEQVQVRLPCKPVLVYWRASADAGGRGEHGAGAGGVHGAARWSPSHGPHTSQHAGDHALETGTSLWVSEERKLHIRFTCYGFVCCKTRVAFGPG